MTSVANAFTEALAVANTYDELSTTVGAVAILLLMTLLLAKETLRAAARPSGARIMAALDAGILPLLGTAGVVVVARLAALL